MSESPENRRLRQRTDAYRASRRTDEYKARRRRREADTPAADTPTASEIVAVTEALAQVERGEVYDLGSFAEFLDTP